MKNIAATALTVFVYAQGLLCVAAVATVILRHQPVEQQVSSQAGMTNSGTVAIRL